MNGKQAKRIRNQVMETFPAANLPDRLIERGNGRPIIDKYGTIIDHLPGPLSWHETTQRYLYQKAKKAFKNR